MARYIQGEECFCFIYGDGLADVESIAQIEFHGQHGNLATITAVTPQGRYGALEMSQSLVTDFSEKRRGDGGAINGGFIVLPPRCLDLVDGDSSPGEARPRTRLAEQGQLEAYEHKGFWQAVDTLREKNHLEHLWESGTALCKVS